MQTHDKGKGLEISNVGERDRLVRRGWDVGGRPEPQTFRESWVGRWRLVFVLVFAFQKGTLFARRCFPRRPVVGVALFCTAGAQLGGVGVLGL